MGQQADALRRLILLRVRKIRPPRSGRSEHAQKFPALHATPLCAETKRLSQNLPFRQPARSGLGALREADVRFGKTLRVQTQVLGDRAIKRTFRTGQMRNSYLKI